MTEPQKLCDGIIHCKDKGDEQQCPCTGNNFKCEKFDNLMYFLSSKWPYFSFCRSLTCVANATVCDGAYDCPEGEDEDNCIALKSSDEE